ncbi:MipA/OmpV family protein [Piscirickettsia litoralis]|uniref:Structural protein MipA n=1 Tax=Piscirickettsia litoralis TaxID=1891921 RepID=A0ABX3A2Y5_9GAMM|nr:MipA/OmpV family protein [Piscirickettsia litoralis]ODN41991.1 hypothetical protein BGC07_02235 [Piscirickettsia litoralis]
MKRLAWVATIACLSISNTASALLATAETRIKPPSASAREYALSLGVGTSPEYSGSKNYKIIPLGSFSLKHGDYRIDLNGLNWTANVVPSKIINLGPSLRYSMGRGNDTGNQQVDKLSEVDKGLFAGFYLSYSFYKVVIPYDKLSLRTNVLKDINGNNQGYTVNFGVNYSTPLSKRVFIISGLSATYASSDYMQSFYGISAADSVNSGISQYDAKPGIKDAGVFLMTNYILNKSWSTYILAKYTRLLDDAKDSSIVRETGTANQWFGGVAFSYRF